jgi:hypothetical protein
MIGGGRGAFIGAVHRIAARMDRQAELVVGAFSPNSKRSPASGADLFRTPQRVYACPVELAAAEVVIGPEGMAFIEAAVRSSRLGARWMRLPKF